jgi:hypothetical protein
MGGECHCTSPETVVPSSFFCVKRSTHFTHRVYALSKASYAALASRIAFILYTYRQKTLFSTQRDSASSMTMRFRDMFRDRTWLGARRDAAAPARRRRRGPPATGAAAGARRVPRPAGRARAGAGDAGGRLPALKSQWGEGGEASEFSRSKRRKRNTTLRSRSRTLLSARHCSSSRRRRSLCSSASRCSLPPERRFLKKSTGSCLGLR